MRDFQNITDGRLLYNRHPDFIVFIVIKTSSGFVISSLKYRSIVSHIVWYSPPTSETTIGVVGCNPLWRDVNDKADVKASYGLSVSL